MNNPYFKKIQSVVNNMILKPVIAKQPASESSLGTPTITSLVAREGFIKQNEAAYRISAINQYGETIASDEVKIAISTSLDSVRGVNGRYAPGNLERGIYYYGVTAVNDNGETTIGDIAKVSVNGVPSPIWAETTHSITLDGLIPRGRYYYTVTAVKDGKETTNSTHITVDVNQDNSSVTVNFKAVEGADGYNLYGRERGSEFKIASLTNVIFVDENQTISIKDNGSVITGQSLPSMNLTTSGVKLNWGAVNGRVKYYRIYGRTSPTSDNLRFITEVPGNVTTWIDNGLITPNGAPPTKNSTGSNEGSSIEITWEAVPNATGYRIYGREPMVQTIGTDGLPITTEEKGYLITIPNGNTTTWVDSGNIEPDFNTPPPSSDSTEGTKGVLGSVIPDGKTLVTDSNGVLSIKGNVEKVLGNMNIVGLENNHIIVYSADTNKWVNMRPELFFTTYIASITPDVDDPTNITLKINADSVSDVSTNLAESLASLTQVNRVTDELKDKIALIEERLLRIENSIGMPSVASLSSRSIEEPIETNTTSTKSTKKSKKG